MIDGGNLEAATSNNLPVETAAKLMKIGKQFIRVGLQEGTLPFGWAVKTSTKYTYYISPKKFTEHTGIEIIDEHHAENFKNNS